MPFYLIVFIVDDGNDVASVKALLRKHEITERDLAAVGTKLTELFAEVWLYNIIVIMFSVQCILLILLLYSHRLRLLMTDQAGRLVAHYADHGKPITTTQSKIAERWETLQSTSTSRKNRLTASLHFYEFNAEYRYVRAIIMA